MSVEEYTLNQIDRRQRLRRSLAKMPDNYHRLIVLLYLMGYRQNEIAAVFGVTRQRIQQTVTDYKRRNGLMFIE